MMGPGSIVEAKEAAMIFKKRKDEPERPGTSRVPEEAIMRHQEQQPLP